MFSGWKDAGIAFYWWNQEWLFMGCSGAFETWRSFIMGSMLI